MSWIVGIITDKGGRINPGVTVIAREDANPAGDTAQAVAGQNAGYRIQAGLSATLYKLYVNSEEGGVDGPNFAGWAVSSGNVSAAFTLLDDSDWKIEHYGNGEGESGGTHKSITADDIEFRTGGYIKHEDELFDFRLGSDTRRLRIDSSDDSVFWFMPYPVPGSDNLNLGLHEGNGATRYFYFGSAKTYWIRTDGDFNLEDGTLNGAITSLGNWTISSGTWSFTNHPRQASYIAPTLDVEYAPKKYIDDVASAISETQYGFVPVWALRMVSDIDQGGGEPGVKVLGDAHVADDWGGSYIDGHIYEYDGATFIDIMGSAIADGTKVIVKSAGVAGSFVGHTNEIATYDGSNWIFSSPTHGNAIIVVGDGSQYEWKDYAYNNFDDVWNKIN